MLLWYIASGVPDLYIDVTVLSKSYLDVYSLNKPSVTDYIYSENWEIENFDVFLVQRITIS